MKNILISLSFFLLSHCAGYINLEERVLRLEQLQNEIVPLTELAGADSRWRDGRTTEGTHNVDEITGMADGDWTTVLEESGATSSIYFYAYDTTNCPSSDDTLQIDGSGGGCWHLVKIHVLGLVGEAADGTHYIDVSNAGDLDVGDREDGRCWYDKTDNRWECYDGTNIQYWTPTGTE